MFKFIPAVNRTKVCSDLEIPASFVKEIRDVFDDGSIKRHILQITPDGIRAGLTNVIHDLAENEGVKFKMDVRENGDIFLLDAAISSENDATRTCVIGRVVSDVKPATYKKL